MNVVLLTGDETRHNYFRKAFASDNRFRVLATYCEGVEKSLEARTRANETASKLEYMHVQARTQAEKDFFEEAIQNYPDYSNPVKIRKGEINSDEITSRIIELNPDVIVCYGSSLIKSALLEYFKGRFLNVHLGLSPYYRGSGTNIWPLINKEPYMVGATFMYIDPGIDTGEIIHQIRADIFLGDSPHSIGNRLIRKMTAVYADIVANYYKLTREEQPASDSGKLYKASDFDARACRLLYQNCNNEVIEYFIEQESYMEKPPIVMNKGLK